MEIVNYKPGSHSAALDRIRSRSLDLNQKLVDQVAEIVEGVRTGGDEALIHYSEKFDGVTLKREQLRIKEEEILEAADRADPVTVEAFRQAIENVRLFHERQIESTWQAGREDGSAVGQRIMPIESAGLYVPGGLAAYPSSVIMNAIPAQIAGVRRIAVTTPPGTLQKAPAVAAVLADLGLGEVYRVGGAQAVAAFSFGTETIPRVDKIVGPGNIYVAIAKKLVFGSVGIDSIAGPTEVVVLADESADPRYISADLLAQAEHSEDASAICITTSQTLAQQLIIEVERQLQSLERSEIARSSINKYGAVFVVESLEEGCELVNSLAPEHLELMTVDDDRTADLIDNAGAIFFGAWSPEPVGDYIAGPNHVLPTMGAARFSSALGVYDFLKRQSIIKYSDTALKSTAPAIAAMAQSEGLTAHKRAVLIRTELLPAPALPVNKAAAVPPIEKIKPSVRALSPYNLKLIQTRIKLNQNENPFDMPEPIKKEVERRLISRAWSRYPAFVPSQLIERLAQFSGWKPDGLLVGNGSNELIQAVLMVTVAAGKRVVICEPTFALYRQITQILGGEVISVPLTSRFEFDTDAIRQELISSRPDVLIVCSPNNPTGRGIPSDDLFRLASGFSGIVVVDEAYHEFSGATAVPLLEALPNLIVLRTFSKAMAMAGLRVGYLLGAPELVREVRKALLPYNLNFFSATAAEVACENYELLKPLVNMLASERERVQEGLARIRGIDPIPSQANFILIRTSLPPQNLFEELSLRDILVRDVSSYPMLNNCVRISVGTPEENDRLLEALGQIMSGQA